MVGSDSTGSPDGIPPFHLHPGHSLDGFELVEPPKGEPVLLARCSCGEVLDVADARFARCAECLGRDDACARCGGTGRVVDHAALQWRPPIASV
jgi:hypothetical protein